MWIKQNCSGSFLSSQLIVRRVRLLTTSTSFKETSLTPPVTNPSSNFFWFMLKEDYLCVWKKSVEHFLQNGETGQARFHYIWTGKTAFFAIAADRNRQRIQKKTENQTILLTAVVKCMTTFCWTITHKSLRVGGLGISNSFDHRIKFCYLCFPYCCRNKSCSVHLTLYFWTVAYIFWIYQRLLSP